ncbi:zinc finger BED domain-containing protein 4-like [Wyeomyia smithii]|uniref:zinc finger BED domain-containing protein 4-like n=1 Tax=Wyeomyia smithii TaxID=174621 RepID=UPI002467BD5B|nr:zinc finger BED domain-containing protein 4-like [Wyeomyia smithii]
MANIEKRFQNVEKVGILAISTLLDPRFKKLHFESALNISKTISWIVDMMQKITRQCREEQAEPVNIEPSNDLWAAHDTLAREASKYKTIDHAGGLPGELRQYLHGDLAPRNSDPVVVWNQIQGQFPTLYKIAMKHMPVLGTSVASERLFSKAGQTITKLRNRLSGPHLEMLLILQSIEEDAWFQ